VQYRNKHIDSSKRLAAIIETNDDERRVTLMIDGEGRMNIYDDDGSFIY
jgi:hypothetical protein